MVDNYLTLEDVSLGEFKDRGSKFIAFAVPVKSEEEVKLFLDELKPQHLKARHFCYAYLIGIDKKNFRYNDDGEPSGTAGKPIYGQIQSFDLIDVLIVVVRYFGGTKLGASGLINAYREAAKLALNSAQIVERFLVDRYQLTFKYDKMGFMMNTIKNLGYNIVEKRFENDCMVIVEFRKSAVKESLIKLKSVLLNVSPEYVEEKTKVEFCKIEKLDDA